MKREELKKSVYSVLSDKVMIVLAIIAVPVIIAQFYYAPGTAAFTAALVLDALIYFVFFAEFVLKVGVEKNKMDYIRKNKLDSIISIIIILSPIPALLASSPYLSGVPAIRAIRASRLFRATRLMRVAPRVVRSGSYVVKGVIRNRRALAKKKR